MAGYVRFWTNFLDKLHQALNIQQLLVLNHFRIKVAKFCIMHFSLRNSSYLKTLNRVLTHLLLKPADVKAFLLFKFFFLLYYLRSRCISYQMSNLV